MAVGIFASPVEPFFNHKGCSITSQMLQDWLIDLANHNSKHIQHVNEHQGFFIQTHTVETIMLASEKLKITLDAKYLAIELFDRFLFHHLQELYSHSMKISKRKRLKEWFSLQDHLSKQVMLRMVSCCQIASKLTSHYRSSDEKEVKALTAASKTQMEDFCKRKVVSVHRARKFLSDYGFRYTSDSLLQSELRVLKTLKFEVTKPTPLVFIETILEIVGHNNPDTPVKTYYAVATKLLDLVYMKYQILYRILFEVSIAPGKLTLDQKKKFKRVKADKLLLSTAVIGASVFILERESADKVIEELSKITRILQNDIIDFTSVLIQLVEEDSV